MLFEESESSTIEFKRVPPSKDQILKTIIGFANLFGGRLIIGIEDNREIIGVDEQLAEQLLESIPQSIVQRCSPTLLPTVYLQRIQDMITVVIEISAGLNKPYFITSKGLADGTYFRSGTQTLKATPDIIQELQWTNRGKSVDWMPVYTARITDLNQEAFKVFLKRRRHSFQQGQYEQILENYHLIMSEHGQIYPSVAGMMLFGQDPQHHLTESFTICTHFEGTSGRKAIATRDCIGTLFQQYEDILAFLRSRLNRSFEIIDGGKRQEELELPEDALREVVINALVHRDYLLTGPTKVAIYDDRIEIFSPGNFPGPLTTDRLEMGFTHLRNFAICRVFREAQYIEKLGSGFLTLFQRFREYNLARPEIIEGYGFVKVVLTRDKNQPPTPIETVYKEDILRLFYHSNEISIADIMQYVNISRTTAGRILSVMVEEGILVRKGKGPATRYHKLD